MARTGNELRGFAFPISKGKEGYWPRRNLKAIRQSSIAMILGTFPGERVMLPEFGSELHRLVFDPNDELMLTRLQEATINALMRWDPNLEVVGVVPEQKGNAAEIRLFIDYFDRADPDEEVRTATLDLTRG